MPNTIIANPSITSPGMVCIVPIKARTYFAFFLCLDNITPKGTEMMSPKKTETPTSFI